MPPSPEDEPVDSGDYDTIEEAIANVPDGGTLRLSNSTDLEEPLVLDRDITIDLNGNDLGV